MTHLEVLRLRLSHESERLAKATTERERELRAVYVAQCQKELDSELSFLGITDQPFAGSDDDLLAELLAP